MHICSDFLKERADKISCSSYSGRYLPFLWLFVIACLNLLIRIPHLGHKLSWDEAWNLCALKSVAGGATLLAGQFWRHPPVYMELGLLLAPLKPGFEIRMEVLSLVLSTGAILIFVSMISEFMGKRIGVFTGLAYSLLPGALFFDTWVKRDSVAALFSFLAVWAFLKKREKSAGIFLGLALLGKETALFYCGTIFLLALFMGGSRIWLKRMLISFFIAIMASCCWYLLMSKGGQGFARFFLGNSVEAAGFSESWWYYFAKLRHDLGLAGLALLCAGVLAVLPGRSFSLGRLSLVRELKRHAYLPLFLLLPGYAALSFSSGKPPWMTIVLYPALALLVGLGWASVMRCLALVMKRPAVHSLLRVDFFLPSMLLVLILGVQLAGFDYNDYFVKIAPNQYKIVKTSEEVVSAVNDLVEDGDGLIIMPMYYRNHTTMPNPIFFWNLKVSPRIFRSQDPDSYDDFRKAVIDNRIKWVLMSPLKGSRQEELVFELIENIDPVCRFFSVGALVKVDSLWRSK